MTNIHSHPTPLRQKFIEYLTLNRKAERTVHTYVSFIHSLAKHGRRSPDLLGPEDIRQWLYYLIAERKQAASTVNLAINAVRSFYGGLLQREIEPLLHQIKRPRRPALAPRLYSMAEVEKLLTVGTEGNRRARAFLSCVYGGGLRLSEATHIQIKDPDGVRHRLLVSHPKGGRQRYTLLSDNLLTVLRVANWAGRCGSASSVTAPIGGPTAAATATAPPEFASGIPGPPFGGAPGSVCVFLHRCRRRNTTNDQKAAEMKKLITISKPDHGMKWWLFSKCSIRPASGAVGRINKPATAPRTR
jgi:integrase